MLQTYRRNDVVKFFYLQPRTGETFRYGRIVGWRKLTEDKLDKLRWSTYRLGDDRFYRSKMLVTVQGVDGSIQQYYDESMQQVKKGWKIIFKIKCFFTKR